MTGECNSVVILKLKNKDQTVPLYVMHTVAHTKEHSPNIHNTQ
uniref:Uncharacterized protein n=1 Tax=Anguilla anguilla TaxID=7936 RepID=A0A0E9VFE2_ANGAN